MSSRLRGRVARPHEVTVVTVGDAGVGKTALINRFCHDTFVETYTPTSFDRYISENVVANKRVCYTIWDTSGERSLNTTRTLAFREADVFLLCYSIGDPSSLFSAINDWVPELREQAPATPLLLVGCGSDLRGDRALVQSLAKVGKSPVSSQQALAMSQQVEAVMYVETSALTSGRGVASVMEVAALASLGQFSPLQNSSKPLSRLVSSPLPPSPLVSKKHRNRSLSLSRRTAAEREVSSRPELGLTRENSRESLFNLEPAQTFWDQFSPTSSTSSTSSYSPRILEPAPLDSPALVPRHQESSPGSPSLASRSKTGSLSSMSMRSKSSTLSSTRSDSSMLSVKRELQPRPAPISITTTKTPKTSRKSADKDKPKGEKMITIKCQRLRADKTYEEVEIEVPAPVYETMQAGGEVRREPGREKSRGLGTKIKCLFSKTAQ